MTKQEELHEAFAITGQVICHTDLEKKSCKSNVNTNAHIYFFPLVGALRSKRRNTQLKSICKLNKFYIYFK